jgi:hypothetical protein
MVKTVQAAPVNDEQAALAASIAAADANAFTVTATPGEPEDDDLSNWAEVPRLLGSGLVSMLPELKDVYSDDACEAWGKAADKVAKKYGWDGGGLPPEVSLLICTAMFVLPTVAAVKARKAQAIEAAKNPNAAP